MPHYRQCLLLNLVNEPLKLGIAQGTVHHKLSHLGCRTRLLWHAGARVVSGLSQIDLLMVECR